MSAPKFRASFHYFTRGFVILTMLATVGLFSGAALAGKVVLSGTYSASEIKSACGKDFVADGAAYGCSKKAGDGSTTSVTCNWDGKCQGSCTSCGGPDVARGKTSVLGVLSGSTLKPAGAK